MHRASYHATFAERFLSSTRGQIVSLLRCEPMTVEQLARALRLTPKGVRAQLLVLERDGLVRQKGRRRSGAAGKPAGIYEFRPAAEPMFSSAYAPALDAALEVIARGGSSARRLRLLRAIGTELARGVPEAPSTNSRERVKHAASVLASWGGLPQIEGTNGTMVIRSCGCPVSAAVHLNGDVCKVIETALATVIGCPVRERCDRSERPSCCFEVQVGGGPAGRRVRRRPR